MSNTFFQFKQFTIHQDQTAMKVTTDGCLFGAWVAERIPDTCLRILDIGTGTGLLSLMIAQENKEALIDAIEIDEDAYKQARENTANTKWSQRLNIVYGDARSYDYPHKYDIIISNPPFYEKELKGNNAQKNIAHHNNGLLLSQLVLLIRSNLKPGGCWFLLLPYKRNKEIREMIMEQDLNLTNICLVRQTPKHDYFRMMLEGILPEKSFSETAVTEITIKDENDRYTTAFNELLKDFYLHLE